MFTRRVLLKQSALLSLTPVVPAFLAQLSRAAETAKDGRILVVIQLDGGNDGLNTVVPFKDELYKKYRRKLRLDAKQLVKLNGEIGLHPAMKGAGKLFEQGRLAIVQGVGYPNPNRSHFESMAIWQSARLNAADHGQYGWLGRTFDQRASAPSPHAVCVGGGTLPVTLWSRRSSVASLQSFDELALAVPAGALRESVDSTSDDGDLTRFVSRSTTEAFTTAERLTAMSESPKKLQGKGYADSRLAEQLKMIATMIKLGSEARVFYTTQGGYDTHAGQFYTHYNLLQDLSNGMRAFMQDLDDVKLSDRVLVLAFSEFGRRVAENDSEGTDHGVAAPVFLAGPKFAKNIVGPNPNLAILVQGDVPTAIDFRQVYATILNRWLNVRPGEILGGHFEELPILKS